VRSFEFPAGDFSYVIHAATEASAKLNQEDPLLMFDTIVEGTRHTLEFARACNAKKFLLTSSGAVYGKQPSEITHISEDYLGAPDLMNSNSAYGEGKRASEMLCCLYAKQYGIEAKIARCFAFVGPYLPLDTHFAIGNFIRDVINGNEILIKGDGTPYRSYLYAADLAIWLWTILLKGKSCYPYNVGSDEDLTIAELAKVVASTIEPIVDVTIVKEPIPCQPVERYVPSVKRVLTELQLKPLISLRESIIRTADHASAQFKKL
jgi:dTDP-glucose 4,6-dehydratase